jgi:DNA modification methylase
VAAAAGLEHWCHAVMQHDQSQRLRGRSAIINCKPILWYTKGHRRSINGRVSLVPNMVGSTRDKSAHPWAQGDGGVRQWIHHLTAPGERIVDPFAGTGTWGRIAAEMGRHWIGCDITLGGTETVVADALAAD